MYRFISRGELIMDQSFSQLKEDLVVKRIFDGAGVSVIRYLDVGAYSAVELSNTFLFYSNGSSGVLVEPDPYLCDKLRSERPRDIVVQSAMSPDNGNITLYRLTARTMNTISLKHAQYIVAHGGWGPQHIEERIPVPTVHINDILKKHFSAGCDFLSIDTEGLDGKIIKSLDFDLYRPSVVCIETLGGHPDVDLKDMESFMESKNYNNAHCSGLNSIFTDNKRFQPQKY